MAPVLGFETIGNLKEFERLGRRKLVPDTISFQLCHDTERVLLAEDKHKHLEHLAMEHDWRSVCHVAVAVAERLRPHVLVAEGLMAGISEHHMRHPGTLSLRPGTFLSVLSDLIDSVVRAGFKNVLALNGHGGNVLACRASWDQFLQLHQVNLQFLSYWDVLTEADARELLKRVATIPPFFP